MHPSLQVDQIGEIVRARRLALGLTQSDVAVAIGVGQDYVSRIENGKSRALQVGLRRQLAAALELRPEELGVCLAPEGRMSRPLSASEARALVKVASIAREAGDPVAAATAAHHVVGRLPRQHLSRRLAQARAEALLVEAVALGDVHDGRRHHPGLALLDEAYLLVRTAEDTALLHRVTIGNELRKAGDARGAKKWLDRAVGAAPTVGAAQGARIALLRVLGELRDPGQRGEHVRWLRAVEDMPDIWTATLHPLAAAEAEARYLLSFGRAVRADLRRQLEAPSPIPVGVAPQWNVIARLTLAEILMASGEDEGALDELTGVFQMTMALRTFPRLRARGRELLNRNRAAEPALREVLACGQDSRRR